MCSLLLKYNLQYIINDFLKDPCLLPSKYKWKRTVKNAIKTNEFVLWRERLYSETDFEYFRNIQTNIKPALVYTISKDQSYLPTIVLIAKIWARSSHLENKTCVYCGTIYEDFIAHIISTCLISSEKISIFYRDIGMITSLNFAQQLKQLNERDILLKMLGACTEPYIDDELHIHFVKRCYKYVIDCHLYFDTKL